MRPKIPSRKRAVAVVGPGAIGGLLAATLRRCGRPVVLAARGTSPLARDGASLTVKDPGGRIWRATRFGIAGAAQSPREDLEAVFICVKSPDLAGAIASARRLAGPRTAVVSLLNGLTHRAPLRRAFGPSRCVFGVAYFAARRTGPASVWHTGGDLVTLAPTRANRAAALAARRALSEAGWRVGLAPAEDRLLWTKAVFNAAINPLGALTRGTNAALAAHPATRRLVTEVAAEAARIARAAGHPPLPGITARGVLRSSRGMVHQYNSMVQDLEAGRKTESEALLKPFVAAARKTGVPARYIEPLYRMVRRLEKELSL